MFNKFIINIIEKKIKNQHGYDLLPAKSYSYFDNKKGKVIVVSNPRRWKKIDKDNKKNISKSDKITLKLPDNKNELVINISETDNTITFQHDLHKWNKLQSRSLYTNPFNILTFFNKLFHNNIDTIEDEFEYIKHIMLTGRFFESLIMNISMYHSDEVKKRFVNYFTTEEYFKDLGEDYAHYLNSENEYALLPTYRHFLQLILSFEDKNLLKDALYKNAFKSLLILDWIQQRYYYSSVLESLLFYGINTLGIDKIHNITKIDKDLLENFNHLEKPPVPLLNVNKSNFIYAFHLIKEIYNDAQKIVNVLLSKNRLSKLYRGIPLLDFDTKNKETMNELKNYFEDANPINIKEKILDLVKKQKKVKPLTSWTENLSVAKHFADLDSHNKTYIDLINKSKDIYYYLTKYEKMDEVDKLNIGVILEIDVKNNKDLLRNIIMTHYQFDMYWNKVRDYVNTIKKIIQKDNTNINVSINNNVNDEDFMNELPAMKLLRMENEFLFLSNLLNKLNPNNIKISKLFIT